MGTGVISLRGYGDKINPKLIGHYFNTKYYAGTSLPNNIKYDDDQRLELLAYGYLRNNNIEYPNPLASVLIKYIIPSSFTLSFKHIELPTHQIPGLSISNIPINHLFNGTNFIRNMKEVESISSQNNNSNINMNPKYSKHNYKKQVKTMRVKLMSFDCKETTSHMDQFCRFGIIGISKNSDLQSNNNSNSHTNDNYNSNYNYNSNSLRSPNEILFEKIFASLNPVMVDKDGDQLLEYPLSDREKLTRNMVGYYINTNYFNKHKNYQHLSYCTFGKNENECKYNILFRARPSFISYGTESSHEYAKKNKDRYCFNMNDTIEVCVERSEYNEKDKDNKHFRYYLYFNKNDKILPINDSLYGSEDEDENEDKDDDTVIDFNQAKAKLESKMSKKVKNDPNLVKKIDPKQHKVELDFNNFSYYFAICCSYCNCLTLNNSGMTFHVDL